MCLVCLQNTPRIKIKFKKNKSVITVLWETSHTQEKALRAHGVSSLKCQPRTHEGLRRVRQILKPSHFLIAALFGLEFILVGR